MPDPNMNFELLFSMVGVMALVGWFVLLASPIIPVWANRISGLLIPSVMSAGYVVLVVFFPSGGDGGVGSLDAVMTLFSQPSAMLAGWIHYLAFDLLIGAWVCRTGQKDGLTFWLVAPCLPLTFLFGPAGFLTFSIVRAIAKPRVSQTLIK